jgi:hypothetical protein
VCSALQHTARGLEPGNAAIVDMEAQAERDGDRADATRPVRDADHFESVYRAVRVMRLRLATLASFWNACDEGERWETFKRCVGAWAGPHFM